MLRALIARRCFLSMAAWLIIAAVAWPEDGGRFVQVADLPDYGTWGAANWNGRLYVGFYTHPHGRDLPLYRSGVNDETFEFVRMLGSGESLPALFVSSDGSTLHATTEGHSGPRQSPGMHWWTTDSEHAQDWQVDGTNPIVVESIELTKALPNGRVSFPFPTA